VSAVVARVDLTRHARYSYGDSAECIIEYGSYFANSSRGMPMIALSKPAAGPGKFLSERERS